MTCRILGDGKIVIEDINHKHLHKNTQLDSQVEDEIYLMYQAERERDTDSKDITKLIATEYNISLPICATILSRFRESESHNFDILEKWLIEKKYTYRVEWGL